MEFASQPDSSQLMKTETNGEFISSQYPGKTSAGLETFNAWIAANRITSLAPPRPTNHRVLNL